MMFCWNGDILYDFQSYHKAEFIGVGLFLRVGSEADPWQKGDAFSKSESPGG